MRYANVFFMLVISFAPLAEAMELSDAQTHTSGYVERDCLQIAATRNEFQTLFGFLSSTERPKLLPCTRSGWHMEPAYLPNSLKSNFYVAAFVDCHLNNRSRKSTRVTERELGVRQTKRLYAVGECRFKSIAGVEHRSVLGVGLEYVGKLKRVAARRDLS